MKFIDKVIITAFIVFILYIIFKITNDGYMYCTGNNCYYKTLTKTYSVKYKNYNDKGEESFFGKWKIWYYNIDNKWILVPDGKYNRMDIIEKLNIPKEVEF
jgi:hypothetical protein